MRSSGGLVCSAVCSAIFASGMLASCFLIAAPSIAAPSIAAPPEESGEIAANAPAASESKDAASEESTLEESNSEGSTSESVSIAEDVTEDSPKVVVTLGEGRLQLLAPARWRRKKPRTNIVDYEFALPAGEDDEKPARLIIMGAGGGIKANMDRWLGQFQTDPGHPLENAANPKVTTISGQQVHWMDLSGTYGDRPGGPFGPVTWRPDYRMLGAIIATEKHGHYFVKCYGPAKTVTDGKKGFDAFLQSLTLDEPVADQEDGPVKENPAGR